MVKPRKLMDAMKNPRRDSRRKVHRVEGKEDGGEGVTGKSARRRRRRRRFSL
jgi:hypothetical protein